MCADYVVWDVGGSTGLFTMHAASVAARVMAFEPEPTVGRPRRNVALNQLDAGCSLFSKRGGSMRLSNDGPDGDAPALTHPDGYGRPRGGVLWGAAPLLHSCLSPRPPLVLRLTFLSTSDPRLRMVDRWDAAVGYRVVVSRSRADQYRVLAIRGRSEQGWA